MGLKKAVGKGPVGIDTALFIYFVERHSIYASLVRPLFAAADRGELLLVTSAVTLLEGDTVIYGPMPLTPLS